MTAAQSGGRNDGFEAAAKELLALLMPHRQYLDAMERFEDFQCSTGPGYRDSDPPSADEDLFGFDQDDDDNGDTHVQALMIIGPPGTGKSGVLTAIGHRPAFGDKFEGTCDVRPVVRLDIPDLATPKEVIREICAKLNSPAPGNWTRGQISRHLRDLFRDLGVRYILMDEAHVFVQNQTERQVLVGARFLKFMLVNCQVPIILAGEEPLEELLGHKALKRRMHPPIRLGPYIWGNDKDVSEWMGLTGGLAEQLGFAESEVASNFDLAIRLYLDTGGIIGLAAKRLIEAGRLAVAESSQDITKDHLSRAWRKWTKDKQLVATDPFDIRSTNFSGHEENPYCGDTVNLKKLWLDRFTSSQDVGDSSRVTRRGTRGRPSKAKSFGQ